MSRFVMALDQGTTSSRAILFDHDGGVAALDQHEFPQHFPKPGPMPKVPEATDDVKIEVPPDDLPTGERLPKAG